MPPKEIHEYLMETLGNESTSYSRMKQWAPEFMGRRESVEDDAQFGHPKDATTGENVKVLHTQVMCDMRRYVRSIQM